MDENKKGPGGKKDKIVTEKNLYRVQDTSLPKAIIVDIDGTVALIDGRSPFDDSKWEQDLPHTPIISLILLAILGIHSSVEEDVIVIFMTGRMGGEDRYSRTKHWLQQETGLLGKEGKDMLLMRNPEDTRGDVIVKKEMWNANVKDKYNILWVFEDRNKMVNFWRNEIRLPTLQVKDGDY